MLQGITQASPPRSAIARATASHASGLRLETTTRAPCWARRSAIARPMPRLDPVTTATLPVRSNSVLRIGPLRAMLAQFQPAELVAVHLVRPVDDAQRARGAPHIGQAKILGYAGRTMRLHR